MISKFIKFKHSHLFERRLPLIVESVLIIFFSILTTPAAADTTVAASHGWTVQLETSELDDSRNVYISKRAEKQVRTRWKQSLPTLRFSCRENKTRVWINFGELFLSTNEMTAHVRFNKQKARTQRMLVSTNYSAIAPLNAIRFAKASMKSKTLLVRVTPHGENPVTAQFDLTGLDQIIRPLRESCHWMPKHDRARKERSERAASKKATVIKEQEKRQFGPKRKSILRKIWQSIEPTEINQVPDTATVQFVVYMYDDGRIRAVRVKEGSGYRRLDMRAERAVTRQGWLDCVRKCRKQYTISITQAMLERRIDNQTC